MVSILNKLVLEHIVYAKIVKRFWPEFHDFRILS